jgi:hypothetical protein
MSIPHKALHGIRALGFKACEQARPARYIDIDTEIFLFRRATGPAEKLAKVVAVCDDVELLVVETRIHIINGCEYGDEG